MLSGRYLSIASQRSREDDARTARERMIWHAEIRLALGSRLSAPARQRSHAACLSLPAPPTKPHEVNERERIAFRSRTAIGLRLARGGA